MLERNDWFGGAIKTARDHRSRGSSTTSSAPGTRSGSAAPAHAQLGDDLRAHGLEYLNTELPTATLYPGRRERLPAPHRRGERRRARPAPCRRRRCLARAARGVLPERRPRVRRARHGALVAARRGARREGRAAARPRRAPREFAGNLLVSARDWLETTFVSERAHGLLAPWVLHTGLGPDAAASGYMAQVIAVAVQEGGMPIPRGGGAKLADALVALHPRTGRHVRDRRARRARVHRRRAHRGRATRSPPRAR